MDGRLAPVGNLARALGKLMTAAIFAGQEAADTLSRRAREREFAELTEDEVAMIEATYAKAFSG
jgi:hypothetical protein